MTKLEQLYEGKAKKVYKTDDSNLLIVEYKDDATAFNGLKKGTITGKGVINNKMSNMLMQMLEKEKFIWQDAEYKNQVLTECRQMAEAYPSYLMEEVEEQISLSTNAVKILKLQAEGMASAAIAQSMKLSEATVKYHCRETYRKLGVKNKTAAIAEARKRKLI